MRSWRLLFCICAHVKLLYTWLMNQEKLSSLFTTMSEISAKKLCKEMEFRHLKGGEVVVNQGEKGNTCFVSLLPLRVLCVVACVCVLGTCSRLLDSRASHYRALL